MTTNYNKWPYSGLLSGIYQPNTSIYQHPIQTQVLTAIAPAAAPVSLVDAFKPKRAGKNPHQSHIVFILDESSSMSSCRDSTIAGYNEYLAGQQLDAAKTNTETLVSLYKFNGSQLTNVFSRQNIKTVSPLSYKTYNPCGGTNLHDAVGGVLITINAQLEGMGKLRSGRESVIVTILTDGEENQSRTFVAADIKGMVEKAEAKNWGFMFLGANIDAFHAGYALGFNASNTIQFDTKNVSDGIKSASNMTSRMRGAYASGMSTLETYGATAFTDAERALSIGEKNE